MAEYIDQLTELGKKASVGPWSPVVFRVQNSRMATAMPVLVENAPANAKVEADAEFMAMAHNLWEELMTLVQRVEEIPPAQVTDDVNEALDALREKFVEMSA